jgi:TolA-binding protein
MLSSGQLGSEGAANLAIRIGSALTEGGGRWERYPPRSPDAVEKEWVARVLPLISRVASQGAAGEEALYLGAALRYAVKDPDAEAAAIRYLEQYPSSPLSAGIGIRLGHDAFLAGNIPLAVARYRAASEAGNPDASAVARYMLGWIRFQSGDAVGALRELSDPLSEPSFSCEDPSPFEQAVVSLSVRAGEEVSAAQLEAFPPVKRGACAGELFLSRLWETDRKRGNAVRAAAVRDIASRRFPLDAKAASLEVATVQGLLRAGRDDDAFSRALTLRGTYGPDSEWAKSQPPAVQDKAAGELGGTFEAIGERKFDEGIRTKARASFSAAAAMFGEYLQVMKGRLLDAEAEIRLKRAAALLGSGDRRGGVRLLEELAHEGRKDSTGERAAVLYAETMIAGFERKGEAAEAAEGAVVLLLGEHPSATAAVLGLRASVAFLAGKESLRARRTAKKVEASRFASFDQAQEARLIEAEAALFEEDFAAARETADRVLAAAGAGDNTALTARGRDLYLLSSLKEADGLASSGDPKGAAALLERLAQRFSGAPQRPLYLLGAMRMYVLGGDGDSAIRAGSRFLKEYPNKPEAVEAAGVVGPLLEEKGDIASACDLYEGLAGRFPKSEATPHFLFHAARLAEVHGPPEAAARRFASWRMRYSSPGWQWTYATLFLGLDGWRGGERKKSIRLMEEGLRKMDAGLEGDAVWELADLAGRARIAVGDAWAEQFRGIRLVAPLERNIAVKDRLFRRALAAYEKAGENSPLEIAVQADLLSADLLMAYGEAILASQRPRGLKGADRDGYEEALKVRAKSFFERSLTWCANALDRLEEEKGPSDLAAPIRTRLDTAQVLLERTVPIAGGKTQ